MTDGADKFRLDQQGDDFALIVSDGTNLALSAMDVLLLDRIFHLRAGQLLQSGGGRAVGQLPLDAKQFGLNADPMQPRILLTVEDYQGVDLAYGVQPQQARELAALLLKWADRVERSSGGSLKPN
jgi:hypothetical protein